MTARRARSRSGGSPCIVLPYAVADGARNMAVDEAMLEHAANGPTLLRFYGWEPWCLSLGRHQVAPDCLLGRPAKDVRPGVEAVRRPTGGRAVFHGPEITYALACPVRDWGGPRAVLRTVHRALAYGLRSLGVPLDDRTPEGAGASDAARESSCAEAAGLSAASCFRDPAPGELTVRGRKLVGSAQCRRRGSVLQHGSILLEDRQELGDLDRDAGTNEDFASPRRPEGARDRPERAARPYAGSARRGRVPREQRRRRVRNARRHGDSPHLFDSDSPGDPVRARASLGRLALAPRTALPARLTAPQAASSLVPLALQRMRARKDYEFDQSMNLTREAHLDRVDTLVSGDTEAG